MYIRDYDYVRMLESNKNISNMEILQLRDQDVIFLGVMDQHR